jgi:RNA polymerase sigma factor (TIGR02999 family)
LQDTQDILELIHRSRLGDDGARRAVISALEPELARIAHFCLKKEARAISISTGDLLSEAVIRLLEGGDCRAEDRCHFLAIAARTMRHVLVDRSRRRASHKRERIDVTLDPESLEEETDDAAKIETLESALSRLQMVSPERAELVVMRYYGGMSLEEIAIERGVSHSTVKRSWQATRIWLRDAITSDARA